MDATKIMEIVQLVTKLGFHLLFDCDDCICLSYGLNSRSGFDYWSSYTDYTWDCASD